jgi:hypothetical protein
MLSCLGLGLGPDPGGGRGFGERSRRAFSPHHCLRVWGEVPESLFPSSLFSHPPNSIFANPGQPRNLIINIPYVKNITDPK